MVSDKSMKIIFAAGIALVLIALLLLGLIIAGALFFASQPPQTTAPQSINQAPQTQAPQDVVQETPLSTNDSLWEEIQLGLVEKTCLSQARDKAGDLAWAVSSCVCSESRTAAQKTYSCSVSALDGKHPLSISCSKAESACSISSEYGDFTYTFEELKYLAG